MKTVEEATYLGCDLNIDTNMGTEISKIIIKCNAVLNNLQIFWKHSNCDKQFKLRVYNSVIRSKLMYGLESAQLGLAELRQLDNFQLKGFRKILNLATTFGQMVQEKSRTNTNVFVRKQAQMAAKGPQKVKKTTTKTTFLSSGHSRSHAHRFKCRVLITLERRTNFALILFMKKNLILNLFLLKNI